MSKNLKQNVIRILYLIIIAALGLIFISPFIIPIVFAGTIALTLFPLQLKLEQRGFMRKRAALILTALFTVLLSVPFFFFIAKGTLAVTRQLETFSTSEKYRNQGMQKIVVMLKHDVVNTIQKYSERFNMDSYLTDAKVEQFLFKGNQFLLAFFQDFASALPVVFLLFLVMVLCTYSFLRHATQVRLFFQNLLGCNEIRMGEIVKIFIKDSRQVYISNIATGGLQSILVAAGVTVLGYGDFFLIFFITLILSFIPVVGAAPVAFVFALYAYIQEQTTDMIVLLLLGGFAGVVDNLLRPYFVSMGESKIPPVASFIFVIGGAIMMGFPGLFIGLLVGTLAYDTVPLFWNDLLENEESEIILPVIIEIDQEIRDESRH